MTIVAVALLTQSHNITAQEALSPYVNERGDISFPEGFRTSFVHLGSWFVPEGGASGFHDVYTEKKSVEAYRETGEFPDGATLVKELRASKASTYTTGKDVSYATEELKQWFVMIKDSRNRFDGNPLWGDGWGWALYKPDNKQTNIAVDYKIDCLGCHIPAKENDWVYTEAYPTLSAE
ncbi:MAG: hypothetical protein ACJAYF_003034 [Arenicella sp.]|jgi:hypothetical protein